MIDDGAMGMSSRDGWHRQIPAGGSVKLKVGGLHVIPLDKTSEFALGDTYPLTLTSEKAGEMVVDAKNSG